MAPDLSIVVARSLTEAITHLAAGGARVAAGGTELAGTLHIDGPRTTKVVDISQLDDLKGTSRLPDGGMRIGALSTLAGVFFNPEVRSSYAALARAALASDRPDTRARSARDAGISAPTTTACGRAATSVLPPAEFFLPPGLDATRENVLGPADVLTDVLLPPSPAGWASAYNRSTEARTGYPLAAVAATALVMEHAVAEVSVVLGAAAPVPWRAREAEAELLGREPSARAVRVAADAAMADAMPLADNRYKIELFRNLLVASLEEVCGLRPSA